MRPSVHPPRIAAGATKISKKEQSPPRVATVALGWGLMLTGILGLLLPVVPGTVLVASGVFLLSWRYAWLRQMIDKCRARFPGLARALSQIQRGEQQDVQEAQTLPRARKALILDEDIEELALYSKPFEDEGLEVHKCASIESAMRCVEREQFDFALVDQVSPAFEGRRVIRHLVRYNWPMPFIVILDKNMECVREAFELGAAECLQKPVPTAKLKGIIHRFLGNGPNDRQERLAIP